MEKSYFLVIDAGTGSGRAVIFDSLGNQISISQKEWTHINDPKIEGSMGFDYVQNWEILKHCIKDCIISSKIDAKKIKAITSSSMREGIVLYDENQNELWAVANVDSRAKDEVVELKKMVSEEEFYKKSGQTFALGAIPRILWFKKNNPEEYKNFSKFSMISDWVLFKLSKKLFSEPTNGGTSGIYSLKDRNWDKEMCKKVGIKDDIFPEMRESGTIIGDIDGEIANLFGLEKETKIVLGGGDVQLGCVGLGLVESGDCAILGGTFWQQVVNIGGYKTDSKMKIRLNPHIPQGQNQAEAITFFTGLVMRWFRDAFCHEEVERGKKEKKDPYTILEELASNVPVGSNGIIPIFSDIMNYGKWYHASPSFLNLGIDPAKYNKGSIFRSLQENAAIVSSLNLKNIKKFTGVKINSITFAAGASKGKLWTQILSDVLGEKLRIPVVKEATSLGGAIVCMVACGVYKDYKSAVESCVKWEREVEPSFENHKLYKEHIKRWQKAYKAQLKLVDKNITTSMWRAPGI